MKKRILCTALAVLMLFGVFCTGSVPTRAVSDMTVSASGQALIKKFEGFSGTPYDDNGVQLTVGWGTGITAAGWAAIEKNPDGTITEAAAQRLFDEAMVNYGGYVNEFANTYGITFTQGQFDALASLCFNVGGNYLRDPSTSLVKALLSGDPEKIAYAITLYSVSGKTTSEGHIHRRLWELQAYFYDIYELGYTLPEKVRYVLLDGNGGNSRYNPYGFSVDHPVSDIQVEWRETPAGYDFAGWFDKPVGGTQITKLDASLDNGMILYAQWRNKATGQIDDLRPGTAEDVKVKATTAVTLREGPCIYYTAVRTAYANELLHITRVVSGKDGYQWGQTAEGWVRLNYTNYGTTNSATPQGPVTYATVTTPSGLNVRSGPGTGYSSVGSAPKGTRVVILEQSVVTEGSITRTWGKIAEGQWICLVDDGNAYATLEVVDNTPTEPVDPTKPDISGAITVQSVAVSRLPYKLEYALSGLDRVPDATGGQVKLTLSNGSQKWITMTRGMLSGFNNSQPGTNRITVTVGGQSTWFDVQIVAVNVTALAMNTEPTKLKYLKDQENLDLTGATVTVTYNETIQETVPVTPDMVTGFDNTQPGIQTIQVSYKGFTTQFHVEVVTNDPQGISMASLPTKVQYLMGTESLDLTGASLKINFSVTGEQIIPITAEMVTGFDNMAPGMQRLTVTHQGFTTSFDVEIILPTVTFLNYDGSVLISTQYAYGATVTPPAAPYRPKDEKGEYEFAGWDKEIATVTGNTTYTAVFKLIYPVGDVDRDMQVNEDDVIYLLRHLVFPEEYPCHVYADYNKDGKLDEDDVIYLLRHLVYPNDYPLS